MERTRHKNPISDKEIINNVAKFVNRSITMLADDIEVKKGTLYQITAGRNRITKRIKSKIIEAYPTINPDYIEHGKGEIMLTPEQHDDAFKEEVFMQLARIDKKIDLLSIKVGNMIIALAKVM